MPKWSDVKPGDLEFFLNKEQGVLGIDAKPKKDPKVCSCLCLMASYNRFVNFLQTAYVGEVLGKVPQVKCSFSGQSGMADHLKSPFTR